MTKGDFLVQINRLGSSFRLGMEAEASTQLMAVIDRMIGLMKESPATSSTALQVLLAQALAAQERKDFLLVADIFEYEIAPFFSESPMVNGEINDQ